MNRKNEIKGVTLSLTLFAAVQSACAQFSVDNDLPVPKAITVGEKLSDIDSKQMLHTWKITFPFYNKLMS